MEAALVLASVLRESAGDVVEGVIHCSDSACRQEYPIIDGIPLLVPDVRSYVGSNLGQIAARRDLSDLLESLLGDAAGPGSSYDTTRQHLSIYCWDHYADLDPDESAALLAPASIVRGLELGLEMLERSQGPILDLGCSVGRTTFELARRLDGPVLGMDLNFSMLQIARRVLSAGVVGYPRRRVGLVYERREFAVDFQGRERVDFWACDALAPPFADGQFGLLVGLNLLDCVATPHTFLGKTRDLLRPGGSTLLATPYDWSPNATPVEAWIGGHSQRGPEGGASDRFLRQLLTPNAHPQSIDKLRLTGELERIPWHARLHERSTVVYELHLLAALRET